MKQVKIIIERSKDLYCAFAENVEGIYGAGETISEAKESIKKSISLTIKYNKEKAPAILRGEYELVYKYDIESFLKYYKGIFTNSGLERLTGINQRQLQHYASGLKKPRETQKRKLKTALHNLGKNWLQLISEIIRGEVVDESLYYDLELHQRHITLVEVTPNARY